MVKPPPARAHIHLAAWRKHRGLTQEQVAEALNRSHTTIGRWEKGEVKIKEEDLASLAELYSATAAQLLAPVDRAEAVKRLDEIQEIILGLDAQDFAEFMIIARRFRKPPPAN